ncbi:tetratricopeptide repeat protein [Kitasatospora sp. NPDC059577]|uniref:tetratricopeptide repeat protein n=1 Tax=Kitasatospora sp. NPDC059577 TaxID=3346873 RepID=UPI003694EFFC
MSREAVGHYRALAAANPDAHLPDLAMALNNLAADLGQTGRREEALAPIRESVAIRRTLAQVNPALHEAELRRSLQVAAWPDGTEPRNAPPSASH